jgi:hypothetical protein
LSDHLGADWSAKPLESRPRDLKELVADSQASVTIVLAE